MATTLEKTISVLVVDDSAVLRELMSDMIKADANMRVVGTACDGREALKMIDDLRPDVVTLDVQMPRMDGLQTLDAILQSSPVPVIMVSSLTQRSADVTLQALDRGALDYIAKPSDISASRDAFRDELLYKLRVFAGADVAAILRVRRNRQRKALHSAPRLVLPCNSNGTETEYHNCCIAIGISTGGPPALSSLFQLLAPPTPPIAIVQHMPANFTGPFAKRLDSVSAIAVKEAETGDVMRPNAALLAPGGKHLHFYRRGSQVVANIRDEEPVSGHKPSVDVMMQDVVEAYGSRCIGVIMTGMGYDGADGCRAVRDAGGYVFGQDAVTSDVYGMNKVAFTNGAVDRQFALDELPRLLSQQSKKMFGAGA